jgi:multisubunit Na+/H+ antiporter MnhC subunit
VRNLRLTYASAALLILVGIFFLGRADERVQTILGSALLISAVAIAIGARHAGGQRRR